MASDVTSPSFPVSAANDCFSAKNLAFAKVCEALARIDRLASTSGQANAREDSWKTLEKLFGYWREMAKKGDPRDNPRKRDPNDSTFHLTRLLLPHLDR